MGPCFENYSWRDHACRERHYKLSSPYLGVCESWRYTENIWPLTLMLVDAKLQTPKSLEEVVVDKIRVGAGISGWPDKERG